MDRFLNKPKGYPIPLGVNDQKSTSKNPKKKNKLKKRNIEFDGYIFRSEAQLNEYLTCKQRAQLQDSESMKRLSILVEMLQKKGTKYHSKKIEINGINFSSRKEGRRYQELKFMEDQGLISNLELQKRYVIFPKQKDERKIEYIADFYYIDEKGHEVVEDTKGMRTSTYIIKRKLFKFFYPEIKFIEI